MKTMRTQGYLLIGLSAATALIGLFFLALHSSVTSLAQVEVPKPKPTPTPPRRSPRRPTPTPTPRPTPTPFTPARFDGSWEFDREKSQTPLSKTEIWTITQGDKQISIEKKRKSRESFFSVYGGDGPLTVKLDGSETTVETLRGKPTTKAKWLNGGKTLEISIVFTFSGPNGDYKQTTVERWELADGGKTLKVYQKTELPGSTRESIEVYTKTIPSLPGPTPFTPAKFDGVWELDIGKSQLTRTPKSEIWTIIQTDKQISFERKADTGRGLVTGYGGPFTARFDGSETTDRDGTRTVKAKWLNNSKTLEISMVTKTSGPSGVITSTVVEHLELTDGGKTLKVHRKFESPRGVQEDIKVFMSRAFRSISFELIPMSFTTARVDANGNMTKITGQNVSGFIEDLSNGVKLEMVRIPGGVFDMGSPSDEKDRNLDEELRRGVRVNLFYIGRFEVTQEQWIAIMGALPPGMSDLGSGFKSDKQPVMRVSWEDAKEFCKRLSHRTGREYRLPTEAEWEYAARAGTRTPFAFGETITPEIVNYNGNLPFGNAPNGAYRIQTIAVGSLGVANAFGLFDMHGNICEWCEDWYGPYDPNQLDNPKGPATEEYRALRGGFFGSSGARCRAAARGKGRPSVRLECYSFRVVCVPPRTK